MIFQLCDLKMVIIKRVCWEGVSVGAHGGQSKHGSLGVGATGIGAGQCVFWDLNSGPL